MFCLFVRDYSVYGSMCGLFIHDYTVRGSLFVRDSSPWVHVLSVTIQYVGPCFVTSSVTIQCVTGPCFICLSMTIQSVGPCFVCLSMTIQSVGPCLCSSVTIQSVTVHALCVHPLLYHYYGSMFSLLVCDYTVRDWSMFCLFIHYYTITMGPCLVC